MGTTKVLIKKTKTATTEPGRTNHKFQVIGGNGKLLFSTPPRQHYYNESDLEQTMIIGGKALVYNRREEIHTEMMPIFEAYCIENNLAEGSLDSMHKAMDLIFKNFRDA